MLHPTPIVFFFIEEIEEPSKNAPGAPDVQKVDSVVICDSGFLSIVNTKKCKFITLFH